MAIPLTPSQQKAFQTNQARVLVSAGAGSGKTRVLVERFVRLVQEKQARLEEILMVTFTDKAAKEMRERILQRFEAEKMEGERGRFHQAAIGTIHGFCARLLLENQLLVPLSGQFHILDQALQQQLLEKVLSETLEEGVQAKKQELLSLFHAYGFSSLLRGFSEAFSQLKSLGLEPPQLSLQTEETEKINEVTQHLQQAGLGEIQIDPDVRWEEFEAWSALSFGRNENEKKEARQKALELILELKAAPIKKIFLNLMQQVWLGVEREKQQSGWIGFDDFQILARNLLRDHPEIRKRYRERYRFIMVDEYQDTNPLQVEILELLRCENNDFVVGDKKQAIYSFRHASICGFNELEKHLAQGNGALFDLDENFRSAPEILQFVNTFFGRLWNEDGAVAYRPLLSQKKGEERGGVEIALVDQEANGLNIKQAREAEAIWLAQRIQELIQSKESAYSDIVILIRSTTALSIYEKALAQAGVPFFLISGRGFYAQQEIYDVSLLLKVLANPQQDIPLAGFLRSPFVGVPDEMLYHIANAAKEKERQTPLWEGIKNSKDEKITHALQLLDELSQKKAWCRLPQLIEEGIRLFHYGVKSLCFFDGPQRLANLQKLMKVAAEYEEKQPRAELNDFIAYLDRLETEEATEEEASLEEELGNVVRIMTMHKAKGLEFPVVFAVDLGRSDTPQQGDFRFSSTGEFALKVHNPLTNQKEKPSRFNALHEEEKQKELDEKKRLFYVVATRAKERLILIGSTKFKEKKEGFSPSQSWADWLRHFFKLGSPEEALPLGTTFQLIEPSPKSQKKEGRGTQEILIPPLPQDLLAWRTEETKFPREIVSASVVQQFSVTQLMHYQECPYRYYLLYELGWVSQGVEIEKEEAGEELRLSAQDLGTLVHRALEVIPYASLKTDLKESVEKLFPKLASKQRQEIVNLITPFLGMPLFSEIEQAKTVFKEWPFLISVGAPILEGTIDLLFMNSQNELIVVDYKTNKIDSASPHQKIERYRFQLELYQWAVSHFFKTASAIRGGLLFLRRGVWVEIPPALNPKAKVETLLQSIQRRDFTPKPSPLICRDCSAKEVCSYQVF